MTKKRKIFNKFLLLIEFEKIVIYSLMRGKSILLPLIIIGEIFCIFDEEIIMEKPIKKSALFFRALNENEYYISNSASNIIFNIRNGNKRNFTGIIPQDSTIYEPYLLFVNQKPSLFIDAHHIYDFIKIYNIMYIKNILL